MFRKMDRRWLKAQEHEKEYFTSGKNKQWKTPHSLEYWLNFLQIDKLLGIGLEIGCGPNGLYNFTNQVIGLDPINYSDRDNFINCTGESIPFNSKFFDFIICCNSLDHCRDPELVVKEMFRLSNNFIIWSNIFPQILTKIIEVFDKTHPYHFSTKSLRKLFQNTVCTKQIQKPIYSWHGKNATLKGKLKLFIASLLGVKGVCIHLETRRNE